MTTSLKLGPTLPDHETGVEVLEARTAHQNFTRTDIYKIRTRKYDGEWSEPYRRDVVSTGGSGHATAALLYEPERDVVLLIEQFRMVNYVNNTKRAWQLEIVAGLIDLGETPEETIRRETIEEAGCEVVALEKIAHFAASPGIYSETVHMYLARVTIATAGVHGLASEDEDIRSHVISFDDALSMADNGFIQDAKTLLALNWLARHREAVRHRWLAEG
jgi:ADP-ribose pyrophosphatase